MDFQKGLSVGLAALMAASTGVVAYTLLSLGFDRFALIPSLMIGVAVGLSIAIAAWVLKRKHKRQQ